MDKCPNDTENEVGKYICKDIDINKCLISENKLRLFDENFTKVEKIAKNYAKEFYYTNNHISILKNNIYKITLYKNKDCLSKLNVDVPEIEFDECLSKIKKIYDIDENVIIIIITKTKNENDYPKMIYWSMNNPTTAEELLYDEICVDDSFIANENLEMKINKLNLDINMDYIKYLADQNINVFDLNSGFYTDICYEFDSPLPGSNNIPLKDRIKLFFPNITLCENHCEIKGVNLTTLKSICECKMKKIFDDDLFENSTLLMEQFRQIQSIIKDINIEVLKCYRSIFIYKYFISCYGGFMVMVLILIQIIVTIIYYCKSIYLLRKYIFNVSDNFVSYLLNKSNKNEIIINNKINEVKDLKMKANQKEDNNRRKK